MTILINTDKNISGNERLEEYLNSKIKEDLAYFSDEITRVEVHLSDENAAKAGSKDKRCLIEARLKNLQPIAVTSFADTIENAVNESLSKLQASLKTRIERLKSN